MPASADVLPCYCEWPVLSQPHSAVSFALKTTVSLRRQPQALSAAQRLDRRVTARRERRALAVRPRVVLCVAHTRHRLNSFIHSNGCIRNTTHKSARTAVHHCITAFAPHHMVPTQLRCPGVRATLSLYLLSCLARHKLQLLEGRDPQDSVADRQARDLCDRLQHRQARWSVWFRLPAQCSLL